jgi:hypothetical protein
MLTAEYDGRLCGTSYFGMCAFVAGSVTWLEVGIMISNLISFFPHRQLHVSLSGCHTQDGICISVGHDLMKNILYNEAL